MQAWAKYAALHNLQMQRYRETIINDLVEKDGYSASPWTEFELLLEAEKKEVEIEELLSNPDRALPEEIKQKLKAVSEEEYRKECEAIAASESLTEMEYKRAKKKKAKPLDERYQERKGDLERRYLTNEIEADLIERDDKGWYPQIKLHYYLTVGREFLEERDKAVVDAQIERGQGRLYKKDVNDAALSSQVFFLDKLGININEILDSERSWTHESAEKIATIARKNAWYIKSVLGVSISDKLKPIEIVQRLLKIIGRKLVCIKRSGKDGERKRIYQLKPIDDGRFEVFDRWLERNRASTTGNINIKFPVEDIA